MFSIILISSSSVTLGVTFVAHLCQLTHHFQLFLRGVFGIPQGAFDTGVAQRVLGGLQVTREGLTPPLLS